MSVLIRGMELPSGCASCDFANYLSDGEPYCRRLMRRVPAARRLPDCPLVPVPPHGRLIAEADAIETAWMILKALGYRRVENHQLEQAVRETFATVPAIEVE